MKDITSLLLMFSVLISVYAQDNQSTSVEEMKKLNFLEGKWKGSGWMFGFDGQRHEFNQTEDIKYKVEGEALLIEGIGRDKETDAVVHHALATVTYSQAEGGYKFYSYAAGRGSGVFKGELLDEKTFQWLIETERGKQKFIITINEAGQWFEIGEYYAGDTWRKFFEMTLDKE